MVDNGAMDVTRIVGFTTEIKFLKSDFDLHNYKMSKLI